MAINVDFGSQVEKTALTRRAESVRSALSPQGTKSMDNYSMMDAMLDIVEWSLPPPSTSGLDDSSACLPYNKDHGKHC